LSRVSDLLHRRLLLGPLLARRGRPQNQRLSRVVTDAESLDSEKDELKHHCDYLSGGAVVLMRHTKLTRHYGRRAVWSTGIWNN
jgi:hypothetical protein